MKPKYPKYIINIFWVLLIALSACSESRDPTVTDLVAIQPPIFDGAANSPVNSQQKIITTASKTFDIHGRCDSRSVGIQYSIDGGVTWQSAEESCQANNTFKITITLDKQLKLLARAKSRFSFSQETAIEVQFKLAATSPNFLAVVASGNGDAPTTMLNFSMGQTFVGGSTTNGSLRLQTQFLGTTYSNQ